MCQRTIAWLACLLPMHSIPLGCGIDRNAPDPDENGDVSGANTATSGGGGDPVAACEDLEDLLADCEPSLEGSLMCSNYVDATCDLSPYFDCVADAYGTCSNGTFPDADSAALQECATLSSCS